MALWRSGGRDRVRAAVRFLVLALIASAVVLAATGIGYEAFAEFYDRGVFPQEGRSVDIGGYKLNLNCSGQGSFQPPPRSGAQPLPPGGMETAPTVVLDSGVGEPALEWALVQPLISNFARVCSYDRAGYGWSDPGPAPRTSAHIVEELHTLLLHARVAPPYILVGHSFGGLNVRLYAARYPEEVSGVVLVDASHPDQEAKGLKPNVSPLASLEPTLLRLGVLRALFVLHGGPELHVRLRNELEYLMLQKKAIAANFAEVRAFSVSAAQVRAAGNLGDKPLAVLTAANFAPRQPQLRNVWINELQPDLVRLSTRGKQIMVNSGHYIPLQQPGAVAAAVREIVEMIHSPENPRNGLSSMVDGR